MVRNTQLDDGNLRFSQGQNYAVFSAEKPKRRTWQNLETQTTKYTLIKELNSGKLYPT